MSDTQGNEIILVGNLKKDKMLFTMEYAQRRNRMFRDTGKLPMVWNPVMLPDDRGDKWMLRQCCNAIFDSPGAVVVMLPQWFASRDAVVQHELAVALGMKIEYSGE